MLNGTRDHCIFWEPRVYLYRLAQWPPSNTTWFVLYATTTGQLAQIWRAQIWRTMKNRPRPGWCTTSRNGTRFPQALISSYKILQQHWEITYRENSNSHDVRERAAAKLTTRPPTPNVRFCVARGRILCATRMWCHNCPPDSPKIPQHFRQR